HNCNDSRRQSTYVVAIVEGEGAGVRGAPWDQTRFSLVMQGLQANGPSRRRFRLLDNRLQRRVPSLTADLSAVDEDHTRVRYVAACVTLPTRRGFVHVAECC